jgi:hypothetical protein
MNERAFAIDDRIDSALATYPSMPLPAGFTQRVMRQVVPVVVSSPPPARRSFHLDCLDLALSIFFTSFFVSAIWILLWTIDAVKPFWLAHLQADLQALGQTSAPFSHWLALILALAALIELSVGLTFLIFWLEQPRLFLNRYTRHNTAS